MIDRSSLLAKVRDILYYLAATHKWVNFNFKTLKKSNSLFKRYILPDEKKIP